MAAYREEIESGHLRVVFIDECHLLWGDGCGYVWGKTDQTLELPVVNERQKQTYYGAVDYLTGESLIQAYASGNSEHTVEFLEYLQKKSPGQRLLVMWDGASYHRSHQVQDFLGKVNNEQDSASWAIHCICFAPHCPQQNPIEDVWLQAKTWVRRFCGLARSFRHLKWLFEWFLDNTTFEFPKLQMYGSFSKIK